MIKRVFLFIITNLAVIATISIIVSLLGLKPFLSSHGIDYTTLAIFAAIWGSAGAFISLLISRYVAKTAMGVQLIDPRTQSPEEKRILSIVHGLAKRTGVTTMPEVGFYESPELNAFATGPTKNRALVAVSTGLMQKMNEKEIEAVLGHEISHVNNGDMVTMTLIQGIVNSFAIFFSRIIAYLLSMTVSRGEQESGGVGGTFYFFTIIFDILFTLFGSLVVAAFSRRREYRADYGGAKLVGKVPMIDALKVLAQHSEYEDRRAPSLSALKINHRPSGWRLLFSTHPPIEKRIERLEGMS